MLHHIDRVNAFLGNENGHPGSDCDGCGDPDRDLYYNESTGGLVLCDACDQLAERLPGLFSDDADERAANRQRYVIEYWLAPPADYQINRVTSMRPDGTVYHHMPR